MELLDFEAKEAEEDAQAVRTTLFARKDDALAPKRARAEREQDGLAVALVLTPDAHKLLQQRGGHAHAIERALRLVRADGPVGRDAHRSPQRVGRQLCPRQASAPLHAAHTHALAYTRAHTHTHAHTRAHGHTGTRAHGHTGTRARMESRGEPQEPMYDLCDVVSHGGRKEQRLAVDGTHLDQLLHLRVPQPPYNPHLCVKHAHAHAHARAHAHTHTPHAHLLGEAHLQQPVRLVQHLPIPACLSTSTLNPQPPTLNPQPSILTP